MTREIKESDWKVFRTLHKIALERYCKGVLAECERMQRAEAKSAHEKYLALYQLLQKRDKELAQLFDDFRRSTAFFQIAAIKGRGLLTKEEFGRFSEETRNLVAVLLGEVD